MSRLEPGHNKLIRRLWRVFVYGHFQLFGRRRYRRLSFEKVDGKSFVIMPSVFNPRIFRSGEFMAGHLNSQLVPCGAAVLDMGTGSGIGAVMAGRWADRVVAVDINPEAVRCARMNILLNRMEERVEVRDGDLFDPLGDEQFDVVLFNPPFLRGEPGDALEGAFRSNRIAHRFAADLERHLRPGGHALVVLSSNGEEEVFLGALQKQGFDPGVVAEEDLISEVFRLYKCPKGP